jgi:glucose-6-phosphate-specific signal transduction histidine kinase
MKPLTQYGLMAEKHWREFRPKMVAELAAANRLHEMLLDTEEQTDKELDQIRRQLIQRGLTAQQAHDQAWETVRERYIFLPPEN